MYKQEREDMVTDWKQDTHPQLHFGVWANKLQFMETEKHKRINKGEK